MDAFPKLTQEPDPSARARILCPYLVTIRSLGTGNFVTADSTYDWNGPFAAMLRARTPPNAVGHWERFYLCREPGGATVIRSVANGLYVKVDRPFDWHGPFAAVLRARTPENEIGPWERFRIEQVSPSVFKIKSLANSRYVAAERRNDVYRGMLRARTPGDKIGPWEKFAFYPVR